MKAFEELTPEGQRRRIRTLVRAGVESFGLAPERTRIRHVATSFNTVFRVVEEGGPPRALRVSPAERIHADGTEAVETRWMGDLRAGGLVSPPAVFDGVGGTPVVRLRHPGVPGARTCTMFSWAEGPPLGQVMTLEGARNLGALAGFLHESAPTVGIAREPPLVADRVLHWKVENRLPELGTPIEEAADRAQRLLDEIWAAPPHRPMLLHGDLTPDNVIVGAQGLVPIDFQDLVWGFDLQDLAITLTSLRRFGDVTGLTAAFRGGYSDVRRWPELDEATLAALTASRRLHQLNLALNLRRPGFDQLVQRGTLLITEWMR